jgi:myo-inositol-1(or 4)-monophosphatase
VLDLSADMEVAIAAVRAAGEAILPGFRSGQDVRYKSADQPVTDSDLLADEMLKAALIGARPEYGWLSEETKDSPDRLGRERVWVVDPIDGTNSFVKGIAEWAISVDLAVDGEAVLGIVHNPVTGELFHAVRGGGAFLNGEPIRVSAATPQASERTCLASRGEMKRGEFDRFHGWTLKPLGSTAYKMAKVADGTGDVFVSRGPKSEWDVCGADVIVTEAGGRVTDSLGRPLAYNRPNPEVQGTIATNGALHDPLCAFVGSLPPVTRVWR